jgi:hypothetical protein
MDKYNEHMTARFMFFRTNSAIEELEQERQKGQLSFILTQLYKTSGTGLYTHCFDQDLHPSVAKELERRGYSVEGRNVSWNKNRHL